MTWQEILRECFDFFMGSVAFIGLIFELLILVIVIILCLIGI